jgi:hypothetical protein
MAKSNNKLTLTTMREGDTFEMLRGTFRVCHSALVIDSKGVGTFTLKAQTLGDIKGRMTLTAKVINIDCENIAAR